MDFDPTRAARIGLKKKKQHQESKKIKRRIQDEMNDLDIKDYSRKNQEQDFSDE